MKRLFLISLLSVFLILFAFADQAQAYYAPATGRFINRDPIAEQGGLNLHAFVRNDAVNAVDPLGHKKYTLTYKTLVKKSKKCGYYRWKIQYLLDQVAPKGGLVAQKVIYKKWKIVDCDTGKKQRKPRGFFELFGIDAGKNISTVDEWGLSKQSYTKGEIKIVAYAKFYSFEQGIPKMKRKFRDFVVHPDLPQNSEGRTSFRRFFPFGPDSNKVKRTLTAKWNCCNGDQDTQLTIE